MTPTVTVDASIFNRMVSRIASASRRDIQSVLRQQSALFIKEAIKRTPPQTVSKTRDSIQKRVDGTVEKAGETADKFKGLKQGASGITWYGVNGKFLFGVEAERDFRKKGNEEAYKGFKELDRKGRRIVSFRGRKGTQRVKLSGRILLKKSQLTYIANRIKKHIGRLKAGWLPAADGLKVVGIPASVSRHRAGAKGAFIDASGSTQSPHIDITNFANGIAKARGIINQTMSVRLEAMANNLRLIVSGYDKDVKRGIQAGGRNQQLLD